MKFLLYQEGCSDGVLTMYDAFVVEIDLDYDQMKNEILEYKKI